MADVVGTHFVDGCLAPFQASPQPKFDALRIQRHRTDAIGQLRPMQYTIGIGQALGVAAQKFVIGVVGTGDARPQDTGRGLSFPRAASPPYPLSPCPDCELVGTEDWFGTGPGRRKCRRPIDTHQGLIAPSACLWGRLVHGWPNELRVE